MTVDRDDYGEPIPAKVCASCRNGEHMFCWGCGCPCNADGDVAIYGFSVTDVLGNRIDPRKVSPDEGEAA